MVIDFNRDKITVVLAKPDFADYKLLRGQDAVVVIAADEFERLLPRSNEAVPFVSFMESLTVDGLDLTRDRDTGRNVEL